MSLIFEGGAAVVRERSADYGAYKLLTYENKRDILKTKREKDYELFNISACLGQAG